MDQDTKMLARAGQQQVVVTANGWMGRREKQNGANSVCKAKCLFKTPRNLVLSQLEVKLLLARKGVPLNVVQIVALSQDKVYHFK